MNIDLKVELIRRFGSQLVAAKQLKIGESKLSYLVRGHAEPNHHEARFLELLSVPITLNRKDRKRHELFHES